ncbi:MAG: cobalamin B12-binding domain-containing protein [Deltaproteobacteria bacterium]|nr:cobalamin B12-binding domain-containing protein [Deltaproteobacteria bacterium]
MRVLLISANREEINMRTLPLGLACVAAATRKQGHEVMLLDLMEEENPIESVQKGIHLFDPEVIGLSIRNIDDQKMEPACFLLDRNQEIISLCRQLSPAPIILGGAGFSIFPEQTLEYLEADMGIQGEGEAVFPELVDRLHRKEDLSGLPGLYLRGRGLQGQRTFVPNLDTLPWPNVFSWFGPVRNLNKSWMTVQTRRGCPMDCSYCSTATIEGKTIRMRSPEAVAEDIANQMAAGLEQFYFTDNIFNIPPDYAKALCRQLIGLKTKPCWVCILYPGKVDRELAGLMAEAGCLNTSIGFESGSESVLRSLNKHFSFSEVRQTSQILGDQGIKRMGFLLLGGPGETKATVEESLKFADSLPLEGLKITVGIRIYPGTSLARTALQEGVITEKTNLLMPTFYLARGLEDWLYSTVKRWIAEKPNWLM